MGLRCVSSPGVFFFFYNIKFNFRNHKEVNLKNAQQFQSKTQMGDSEFNGLD